MEGVGMTNKWFRRFMSVFLALVVALNPLDTRSFITKALATAPESAGMSDVEKKATPGLSALGKGVAKALGPLLGALGSGVAEEAEETGSETVGEAIEGTVTAAEEGAATVEEGATAAEGGAEKGAAEAEAGQAETEQGATEKGAAEDQTKPDTPKVKSTSPNQMQKQVGRRQAPKEVDRVDTGNTASGTQPHIHFKGDYKSLNMDETWGHDGKVAPHLTRKMIKWLKDNGWGIPEEYR